MRTRKSKTLTSYQKFINFWFFLVALSSLIAEAKPNLSDEKIYHDELQLLRGREQDKPNECEQYSSPTYFSNTHYSPNIFFKKAKQQSKTEISTIFNSLEEFLSSQNLIRVFAPAVGGYGHLGATDNVIQKVRKEFGFKGWFEVVYPDMDTRAASIIFNFPQNASSVYEDKEAKTRFIKLTEQINRVRLGKVTPAVLGLSGSADDDDSSCIWANIKFTDSDEMMCRNVAELLNVQYYVSVTHDPHNEDYRGSLFQNNGDEIFLLGDHENRHVIDEMGTYFTALPTTLDEAKTFLTNNPDIEKQKPALPTLISAIEKQNYLIMPAYGRTLVQDDPESDQYLRNIFQILLGARYTQVNPEQNVNLPIILPVFTDYKKVSKLVLDLVNKEDWGKYEKPWSKNVRAAIKELQFNATDAFLTADIADVSTIATIENLTNQQVLLLSVGNLDKTVFDGIFTNVGPEFREGYGTLSELYQTGKPHFSCGDAYGSNWDVGFDLITDFELKLQMMFFYSSQSGFCGKKSWSDQDKNYIALGNFILDSLNANSSFSKYFQDLKQDSSNLLKDRVYSLLTKVVDRINGNTTAFGNVTTSLPTFRQL